MKITVLGSGTSTGVPTIGCECRTCKSADPRDKRLRSSILIETEQTTIVIDCSTDFRQQMLTHNVKKIDAVIFTHHHFDHIAGFDDIRPYNFFNNGKAIPIYASEETLNVLQETFPYAFGKVEQIGGGVPIVQLHKISQGVQFAVNDIMVMPILLLHGKMKVLGLRIEDFAYCTDTNYISPESMNMLKNLKCLILDALRFSPQHTTHFTVPQALEVIEELAPQHTWLTHMAHQILHDEDEKKLPEQVHFAYDGMEIYM